MPTEATIDIESLLKPIKGEFPAGKELDYTSNLEILDWRKEKNPDDYSDTDPNRPKTLQPPKWLDIIRMCKTQLTETSKDPKLPAYLTEALTREKGFAGARDGFQLLRKWAEMYLDKIYPVEQNEKYAIEGHEDFNRRLQGVRWLEESAFEKCLYEAPILKYVNLEERLDLTISMNDIKPPENQTSRIAEQQFTEWLARVPAEICQNVLEDINDCHKELDAMLQVFTAKTQELLESINEKDAKDLADKKVPGLTRSKKVLAKASEFLTQKLAEKAGQQPPGNSPDDTSGKTTQTKPPGGGAGQTRDQLYDQLKEIAAKLEKLDAHSPVPLLILKAVELRSMKFPKLVELLNSDARVLQFITPPENPPSS